MRKTFILIEMPNGERQLVKSLDGHEGASIIRDQVPPAPNDHCRLNAEGVWIEDAAAKERARLAKMSRAELVDEVMRRVRGA